MRKHLPPVCTQEKVDGNLEGTLCRESAWSYFQSDPVNHDSNQGTQSLDQPVPPSSPCFTTGEIHHSLPTSKAILKLHTVIFDLTAAYLAQCIVQRLLRFTAAIKKSHSTSRSGVFFAIHTDEILWG